jgi:hypothetical protein
MAKVIDFLTDLSYLLGEDSVPTTGIDSRIGFISRICEDIAGRYKWSWNQAKATVALTASVGELPIDFRMGGIIYVKNQDGDYLSEADERYIDQYGDKVFYINGSDSEGYEITVNNDIDTSLDIEYVKRSIAFTDAADVREFNVPIRMSVARGSLIDIRRSENPFADVAPETAEYENEIKKLFKLERQLKSSYQVLTSKASRYGTRL